MTIDTKRLRELCDAATPGPWSIWTSNSFRRITSDANSMHRDGGVLHGAVHRDGQTDLDGANRDRDLAFIAAARIALPELLDEVERLNRLVNTVTTWDEGSVAAKFRMLKEERDNARANARILAHSYTHDSRPPQRAVDEALAYPARPEAK